MLLWQQSDGLPTIAVADGDAEQRERDRGFMAYTRMRFKAGNEHVLNGQVLRNSGALEDAWTEFQQGGGD
jgi:hypothetical protein